MIGSTNDSASRLFQAGWVNQAARSYERNARASSSSRLDGASNAGLDALSARYGNSSSRLARLGAQIGENSDVAKDLRAALVSLRDSLSTSSTTTTTTGGTGGAGGAGGTGGTGGTGGGTTTTTVTSRTYTGDTKLDGAKKGALPGAANAELIVTSSDGTSTTISIRKNTKTDQVVNAINAIAGVAASLDGNGFLQVTSESDATLSFSNGAGADAVSIVGLTAPSYSQTTETTTTPPPPPPPPPPGGEETESGTTTTTTSSTLTGEAAENAYAKFRSEALRLLTGASGRDAAILAGGTADLGLDRNSGFTVALDRFDLSSFGLDANRSLDTEADVNALLADLDTALTGIDFRIGSLDRAAGVSEATQRYSDERKASLDALKAKATETRDDPAKASASYFRQALERLSSYAGYGNS